MGLLNLQYACCTQPGLSRGMPKENQVSEELGYRPANAVRSTPRRIDALHALPIACLHDALMPSAPTGAPASDTYMQDSWAVKEGMARSDQVLFGVFDGHGVEGHNISAAVADLLPQVVEDALSVAASPPQAKVGCLSPLHVCFTPEKVGCCAPLPNEAVLGAPLSTGMMM